MTRGKLAVLGLGLIGGSVLQAALRNQPDGRVAGWDSAPAVLEAVRAAGYGRHLAGGLEEACAGASMVVVAAPISVIPSLVDQAACATAGGAVITDTGSTKRWILEEVDRQTAAGGRRVSFVGGHPLAGVERDGFAAATPDLFSGQPWLIIDPPAAAAGDSGPAREVAAFVRRLGAIPTPVDVTTHDRLLAYTSHLPYLLATALMTAAERLAPDLGQLSRFTAGGFRDSTRLAMQEPRMGLDLLRSNAAELTVALREVAAAAERLIDDFDDPPVAAARLEAVRQARQELGRVKRW